MLGMILQTGGVQLCEREKVDDWLPGMSPNLKPAVETSPEPDILGRDAGL